MHEKYFKQINFHSYLNLRVRVMKNYTRSETYYFIHFKIIEYSLLKNKRKMDEHYKFNCVANTCREEVYESKQTNEKIYIISLPVGLQYCYRSYSQFQGYHARLALSRHPLGSLDPQPQIFARQMSFASLFSVSSTHFLPHHQLYSRSFFLPHRPKQRSPV